MKNNFIIIIQLILLLGCQNKAENNEFTVIKGATIYDGNGNSIKNGIIVIREGIIKNIGDETTGIPDNSTINDFTGKYITPGLIDAHMHFFQTGFFDSRPDALDLRDSIDYEKLQENLKINPDRYYEAYLRSGVTGVYDVGGFTWSIDLQNTAENNLNAPHVAASGILLTPASRENTKTFNTSADSVLVHLESSEHGRSVVRLNDSLGATGIKIHQFYLNDTSFMRRMVTVKEEIAKRGNKMIVHATTLEQAKEALRMEAKVLVHSVDDEPVDDEFINLAKEANVIYCPTLVVTTGYLNAFKGLKNGFALTDSNNVIDSETKKLLLEANKFFKYFPDSNSYESFLARFEQSITNSKIIMYNNLKRLHEAGIIIAVSTDAGNPGTLHGISIYDEMEAMQEAGISAKDIITMATKNGAKAMERQDDFGTLENGKMADLIILDKNPSIDITNMRSISHVMRGGLLRSVKESFK